MTYARSNSAEAPVRRTALIIAVVMLGVHIALCLDTATQVQLNPTTENDIRLRLDPNIASVAELELLPRIGPKLADNIITWRTSVTSGPAFGCPEDLDQVPRIGPATIEGLRPFLRFPNYTTSVHIENTP
jgi:DNA uptake protein ComE-like DNA-binding protein